MSGLLVSAVSSGLEFLSRDNPCLGVFFFFSETKKSRNLFLMREVSGCYIPVPRQILLCHRENFFNRPLAEGKCDSRDMSCSYIIPSPRTSSHLNEGPRLQ